MNMMIKERGSSGLAIETEKIYMDGIFYAG